MASCGSQSEPSHGLFQPCPLCSGHLAPSWSQKKPLPAPHSRRPLPGATFPAPSRTGVFSLQMMPPWWGLRSHSLFPHPVYFLHTVWPLWWLFIVCLLSLERSFTSCRPGCPGRYRGLSKGALRSASLNGDWGAVCRGCGLLWCSVTCSKYSFIKISYWC